MTRFYKKLPSSVVIKYAICTIFCCLIANIGVYAQDSIPASFFRDKYLTGEFVHYIEGLNDNVVYQGMHSGQWSTPDRLIFSINGNPYYLNKYYIDGMRVDDRLSPGSAFYIPNLEHFGLNFDTSTSRVNFSQDTLRADYASISGNVGNLGGVSPGTSDIIHIFHRTGWEGAYKPEVSIPNRPHIRYAFAAETSFSHKLNENVSGRHSILAAFGSRKIAKYNADGQIDADPLYESPYCKVQLYSNFQLKNSMFTNFGFFLDFHGKKDNNSELNFNWEEISRENNFNLMAFANLNKNNHFLKSSLAYTYRKDRHLNLFFKRNIVDQDGESFEPWEPDGRYHALTWFEGYEWNISNSLRLFAEAYNAIIKYNPKYRSFANEIFCKLPNPIESHFPPGEFTPVNNPEIPLATVNWFSNPFTSGLLENQVGLTFQTPLSTNWQFQISGGFSLDGFLIGKNKSKISPNIIGNVSLAFRPSNYFDVRLKLSYDRLNYNFDHIRYFSEDYLNGEAYDANTGSLILTSGGKYHKLRKGIKQPTFASLELPIHIHFGHDGRHEVALLQTYRKYFNVWHTYFGGEISDFGHFENGIFFYDYGEKQYLTAYQPSGIMGNNFFKRSPFYLSQLTRYTYNGKRLFVSVSWQSMMFGSLSGLGNGPVTNNVGNLSESTANPNTLMVASNRSEYAAAGRADQDKAYILRLYASYDIAKFFQLGVNLKWTDGQPFTNYHVVFSNESPTAGQPAIIPARSRGINPIDGDFGSRENALFNIDLHARFRWRVKKYDMSLTFSCYNIYDFGNSITEYCFNDGLNDARADLQLNIPRGLIVKYQIEF